LFTSLIRKKTVADSYRKLVKIYGESSPSIKTVNSGLNGSEIVIFDDKEMLRTIKKI